MIQKKNYFESELIKNTDDNKHYITIPYVKKTSEKFSRNIKAMFVDIEVKVRIAYVTENLGKYLSLKDSISCLYQNCLVYKFMCSGNLNNQCIGETERKLFVRITSM